MKQVSWYAERVGPGGENSAKRDLRPVVERGQARAPLVNAVFRGRNMSPLIGLYIAWIESEFVNIETPTPMGSKGMFQFIRRLANASGFLLRICWTSQSRLMPPLATSH
jgi:hypothetical protein